MRIPLPIPKKIATSCLNGYTKETRPPAASNLSLSVIASLVCVLLFQVMFTETYIVLLLHRVLTIFVPSHFCGLRVH